MSPHVLSRPPHPAPPVAPGLSEETRRELAGLLVRPEAVGRPSDGRPTQAERALPVREVIDVLLRGRWVVAAVLAAVLGLTALYTFTRAPRYSATSYLLVHKEDTGLSSVLPSDAADLFRPERSLGNELFVLRRSTALARSVAERLIAQRQVPGTGEALSILEVEEGETITPARVIERLREEYVTTALEGDKVDALRVTATSEVPGEAAYIANVYAEAFVNLTRESSRAGYNASRRFLEDQVAQQDTVLARADGALRGYMTTQNAVDPRAEAAELLRQLGTLRSERDAADVALRVRRATVGGLERELEGIEPRLARRLGSSIEREITAAQERIATLDGRIEQALLRDPSLRTNALPADLAELQRQADSLRARVQHLSAQLVEESMAAGGGPGDTGGGVQRALELRHRLIDERIALSGLEAERAVLGERVGTYERQLGSIPAETTDLARLERDRTAAEELHGAFLGRLNEARVAEESELGYAEVIQPADVPADPIAPRKGMNLLVGGLLGLLLGGGMALVRFRLDDRLHRPDDVRAAGQTLLGTIPDVTALVQAEFGDAATIEVDGHHLSTHLISLLNPMATASESYRALRTSVQFSRPDAVIETILVTSAKPGEGKSTTAANLAIVMAQAGRRVLLVDCDLRRPSLHKKLGRAKAPGLVDLLFQDGPSDFESFALPVDNLYFIPAGPGVPNPAELLGSRSMRDLALTFQEAFDLVIFDAPPVLAATDAVLLSTQCDATVVVTSAGDTRMGELEQALGALADVGAKVIGTVLNRFDLTHAYGYRYKYAYSYGSTYAYGHAKAEGKERLLRRSLARVNPFGKKPRRSAKGAGR